MSHSTEPEPLTDDQLYALWIIHRSGRRLIWQHACEGFGEAFYYEGWFTQGAGSRNPYPPTPPSDHLKTLIARGYLTSVGERILPTEVQLEVERMLDVVTIPCTLIIVVGEAGHQLIDTLPAWKRRALARFYDGPPMPGRAVG